MSLGPRTCIHIALCFRMEEMPLIFPLSPCHRQANPCVIPFLSLSLPPNPSLGHSSGNCRHTIGGRVWHDDMASLGTEFPGGTASQGQTDGVRTGRCERMACSTSIGRRSRGGIIDAITWGEDGGHLDKRWTPSLGELRHRSHDHVPWLKKRCT
jgi:hypothetical protein